MKYRRERVTYSLKCILNIMRQHNALLYLLTMTQKVKTNCFLKPRFANFFEVLRRIAQLGMKSIAMQGEEIE